ncbi:MAG TPA: Rieske 2Fe-2S domain-containing protein [Chloroflexota bacterium]
MLTAEDNELITRTGPGTPGGNLMRRYWQPVELVAELPERGAPIPVRLLGEDLVLFRDDQGRPGLLGIHCSHRGADLSYGRLEDGGLRCIYHGWLYDVHGRCLEQPGEPASSTFHEKIRHTAYPCIERAGVIWAYLGPGEPPLFPNYEFLNAPPESTDATKLYQECNYLQAVEVAIDLSHLSFIHYQNGPVLGDGSPSDGLLNHRGAAPFLDTAEAAFTSYGVRSGRIQHWEPDKEIRMDEYILPNIVAFPQTAVRDERERRGYSAHCHVPIDDTRHWKFSFQFSRKGPLEWIPTRADMVDYQPIHNLSNRFHQDREEMVSKTYVGMGQNFRAHDQWATESQGPIHNRTAEHLGALDLALVLSRQALLKAIRDLADEGKEPENVVRDPAQNHFPLAPFAVLVPPSTDWAEFCGFAEQLTEEAIAHQPAR